MQPDDPSLEYGGSVILEADARHAVAEQGPAPELENHVGMRHAGALFALGYAASRALVAAAAGPATAEAELLEGEVAYEGAVLAGKVIATAEPAAGDWEALLEQASSGRPVQLPVSVTLRDEHGKTVTSMTHRWQLSPLRTGEAN